MQYVLSERTQLKHAHTVKICHFNIRVAYQVALLKGSTKLHSQG